MEQLIFNAIKNELSMDKARWQIGIGIYDNMIEKCEIMRLASECKPGSFKLGKVHAIFHYLRVTKAIEFKKINNDTFYKWTNKLEEMV